jgi:hypothetical protein
MVAVIWGIPLVLAMLLVVLNSALLVSGAYQVFTGRPSFLVRLVGGMRRRLPATSADCALLGASQVLQAAALFIGMGPAILPAVASISELAGGPKLPALERWPALVFAGLGYALASLVVAIVCVGVALALNLRVKYLDYSTSINAPGQ